MDMRERDVESAVWKSRKMTRAQGEMVHCYYLSLAGTFPSLCGRRALAENGLEDPSHDKRCKVCLKSKGVE